MAKVRRRTRHGRVYKYNPFGGMAFYNLPPDARGKLQQVIDDDLFWEYIEQLRVLKEKERAVESYLDTIIKRIQRGKRGKA